MLLVLPMILQQLRSLSHSKNLPPLSTTSFIICTTTSFFSSLVAASMYSQQWARRISWKTELPGLSAFCVPDLKTTSVDKGQCTRWFWCPLCWLWPSMVCIPLIHRFQFLVFRVLVCVTGNTTNGENANETYDTSTKKRVGKRLTFHWDAKAEQFVFQLTLCPKMCLQSHFVVTSNH